MSRIRPDIREVRALIARALCGASEINPVDEGVSTHVYRIKRSEEIFYLRVLPEEGATFAPEVEAHALLRRAGVRVPEVVYWDDLDPGLSRAVMLTTEIEGRAIGKDDLGAALPTIVHAAGRDLALINQVPVDGFGWIRRDAPGDTRLRGDIASETELMLADLEPCIRVLQGTDLQWSGADQIREAIHRNAQLLDAPHAHLSHGDFDATHIFSHEGRYTGIIDLGEIRGTGPHYDLGHFRFHDGETLPTTLLPYLLEGYRDAGPLPHEVDRRIALDSLLIGVRFLARMHRRLARPTRVHALAAIERDFQTLWA